MKKKFEHKEKTLRIKLYSIKGNFQGKLYLHADIPTKFLDEHFWAIMLSGKKVPNSKISKDERTNPRSTNKRH